MAQDRAENMKTSQRASLLLGLALLVPFAMASAAWAGGASLDEDEEDDSNAGVSFFGFAKDLDRGGEISIVRDGVHEPTLHGSGTGGNRG